MAHATVSMTLFLCSAFAPCAVMGCGESSETTTDGEMGSADAEHDTKASTEGNTEGDVTGTGGEGTAETEAGGTTQDEPPLDPPVLVDALEIPPSPFPGGLSVDQFAMVLEVDGVPRELGPIYKQVHPMGDTPYGQAELTRFTREFDGVSTTVSVYALADLDATYVIQHEFEFAELTHVTGLRGFIVDVADAEGARLAYGPADNTLYMDEDYLDIPARDGYAKRGRMQFGGIPLNYAWNGAGGLAVGVATDVPGTYELPLAVQDGRLAMEHAFYPDPELAQSQEFGPGDPLVSDLIFVSYAPRDYFGAYAAYTRVLETAFDLRFQNAPAPEAAKRPYWKTWGLDPNEDGVFTKQQVFDVANELRTLNLDRILLDWGWFYTEGDWAANPDVFDDEEDFSAFIQALRADGFHVVLWFQPLQVDLGDPGVRQNLGPYVVARPDGTPYLDDDGLGLLDPSQPEVIAYVQQELDRFAALGVDHLYVDSQEAQLAIPPNYASATPMASFAALPRLYDLLRDFGNAHDIVMEICPDGRSQPILDMPQHVNNVGDPKNDRQLRAEFKGLKAILGSQGIVGAYVDPFPDNQVSGSFLNIVGLGGNLQSLFRSLDDLGRDEWARYTDLYFDADLVSGDYLDLYDIAFDRPEGHVVATSSAMYYSFFTKTDDLDACFDTVCTEDSLVRIEDAQAAAYDGVVVLRGLGPGQRYDITRFRGTQSFLTATADDAGEIELSALSFTREVLLVATPSGN